MFTVIGKILRQNTREKQKILIAISGVVPLNY